jgi:hypothetical protein
LAEKPFWSEGPTVVEWDGSTDERAVSSDGTAYKVSDLKPSASEIVGGKINFNNGSVIEITSDILEMGGYIYSVYYGTIYVNTSNGSAYNATIGATLPEPGIYFQKNTYNQIVSLSYGDETVYCLDEKYIPDTIARVSDIPEQIVDESLSATSTNPVQNKVVNEAISNLSTLVGDTSVSDQIDEALLNSQSNWNQNDGTKADYIENRPFYDNIKTESIYVSSSNQPKATTLSNDLYYGTTTGSSTTIQNGSRYKITININGYSSIYTCTRAKLAGAYQYCNVLGNAKLGVDVGFLDGNNSSYPIADTGEPFCFLSYSSTAKNAIISTNQNAQISAFYTVTGEIKQVDEKFIPDTIARVSDIPEQVVADSELSTTSTNPVQNKVVNEAINNLNTLVGDTSVAEQISEVTYTQTQVDEFITAVREFCLPKIRNITLLENSWNFSANYYYQDVAVGVCTPTCKVDLQPTYAQLATWQDDGLAFTTQSRDGIVRVWAIPDAPREDITVQISVQEVLGV